jgi:hypothetical protein
MPESILMIKSKTHRIVLFEPDEEHLRNGLAGRGLSADLVKFLADLLRAKKWTRKIVIPSEHDNVAAVLVFTTGLKEGGLEIFSELHVFFAGRSLVEKWQVVGGEDQISLLPKEAFRAINIDKVRVEGAQVSVEFSVPTVSGHSGAFVKAFDFSVEGPQIRIVPHPLHSRSSA